MYRPTHDQYVHYKTGWDDAINRAIGIIDALIERGGDPTAIITEIRDQVAAEMFHPMWAEPET